MYKNTISFALFIFTLIITGCDNKGSSRVGNPNSVKSGELKAPNLTGPLTRIYLKNSEIIPLKFVNNSGDVTSCSASPLLPEGLKIKAKKGTCVITGTPSKVMPKSGYLITAKNPAGKSVVSAVITIKDIAPEISENSGDLKKIFTKGDVISTIELLNTGGKIDGCESTPELPLGLVLSVSDNNCIINGVANQVIGEKDYSVSASNVFGASSKVINITVNDKTPDISNSVNANLNKMYVVGSKIDPLFFPNKGGKINSCVVSPNLPGGLTIDLVDDFCVIKGDASIVSDAKDYAVTAINGTGSSKTTINITINDIAPKLNNGDIKLYVETVLINDFVFSNEGGSAASCTSTPSLPEGLILSVDSGSCKISGTPSKVTAKNDYSIKAMNISGSSSADINITVIYKLALLNDTGIDWSGGYSLENNPDCDVATNGSQDCHQGRDFKSADGSLVKVGAGLSGFDFTKLDSSGNELPDNSESWACVKDNHTGLTWEVKDDTDGVHGKNKEYMWGGVNSFLHKPYGLNYNEWNDFISASNQENFCGFSDWRVPSRKELRSIVNYGLSPIAIDMAYFPNTLPKNYWTASVDVGSKQLAWGINFKSGDINNNYRKEKSLLRLVRSD